MLTEAELRRFVGGQVEIRNGVEAEFLFVGEIKNIFINEQSAELIIELKWVAQNRGYPDNPPRWVKDRRALQRVPVSADVIHLGAGRVRLTARSMGDVVTLRPQGDAVFIERSQVEGL